MRKLIFILLPLTFFLCCQDDRTDEGGGITIDYDDADKFFPLALGNSWFYHLEDSTGSGIDTSSRREVVDSCCYYIGVYDHPSGFHLGWKWRDFSWMTMYSNGGGEFFRTQYVEKDKGNWYRIDSSFSQNHVVVDLASGVYEIKTPSGNYTCIKSKTQVTAPDNSFHVVHTRYFGRDAGLVKHRQRFWENYGTSRAYVLRTITQTLVKANLK